MRLQEIHPAIVHFPIGLFPTVLGADILGKISGNRSLVDIGRWGVTLTAGAAGVAVATGAIAQETAELDGEAHDLLVSHRNLNCGFLALATAMAIHRSKRLSPGGGYIAVGSVGLGMLIYSAYLGGHMVYEHGAAVKAAGTVRENKAPVVRPRDMRHVAVTAVNNFAEGVWNTFDSLVNEPLLPNWTKKQEEEASPQKAVDRDDDAERK